MGVGQLGLPAPAFLAREGGWREEVAAQRALVAAGEGPVGELELGSRLGEGDRHIAAHFDQLGALPGEQEGEPAAVAERLLGEVDPVVLVHPVGAGAQQLAARASLPRSSSVEAATIASVGPGAP